MARRKKNTDETIEESQADSEAYTSERQEAAEETLQERQETEPTENAGTVEGEEVTADDRDLDETTMTDDELAALERQDEVAAGDYTPRNYHDYLEASHESDDVNPDAKEFQLDSDRPDEHTGPEAAAEAARTGVNPRSVATASDPAGMEQEDSPGTPEEGRGADEPEEADKVSKSSTDENPNSINK